jgi:hypothetical protein
MRQDIVVGPVVCIIFAVSVGWFDVWRSHYKKLLLLGRFQTNVFRPLFCSIYVTG